MPKRLIFHVDVNSAFLSWEAVRRVKNGEPDLRLVPSCVGGDPGKRTGVVTAKSIPAKKFGIATGEPMALALKKCPELICVRPDFKLYQECSGAFKRICKEYTFAMESFSIDEVFLDMTGMERIYADPEQTAHEIKDRIYGELGFTVNVGIGSNKLCAKMASDFEKPDKVHHLYRDEIPEKMWPLPVRELFTCGKKSAERLNRAGIETIGDLARADVRDIIKMLGEKQGRHLHEYANGIDDSPVVEERGDAKSYSMETTVNENLTELEEVYRLLLSQADVVAARLRGDGVKCGTVEISYRTFEFKNRSHQRKLFRPTDVTSEIYEQAKTLFAESWDKTPLRLVGIALQDIDHMEYEQMSFLVDERKEKQRKLDSCLDSIRGRYGTGSVVRASVMGADKFE